MIETHWKEPSDYQECLGAVAALSEMGLYLEQSLCEHVLALLRLPRRDLVDIKLGAVFGRLCADLTLNVARLLNVDVVTTKPFWTFLGIESWNDSGACRDCCSTL